MRNEIGQDAGNFVAVSLVGNGMTTNRDAIGARVEIVVSPDSKHKLITMNLSLSFSSTSDIIIIRVIFSLMQQTG